MHLSLSGLDSGLQGDSGSEEPTRAAAQGLWWWKMQYARLEAEQQR